MKLNYEDLLSGDVIPVEGVGHIKPPKLSDLMPTSGVGMWTYHLFLNVISWDKEDYLKTIRAASNKKYKSLDNDKIETFDIVILIKEIRELLLKAMAFFIVEEISWNAKEKCFFILDKHTREEVGRIKRDNYEEVRDAILQLNYINTSKKNKPVVHSSKKSQELWEVVQENLKKSSNKSKKQDESMQLGNIISKLCAASNSYNLLNVYNLTIFQLYDQFFQISHLRLTNINEMAFSNHGGEKFNFRDWLKPIFN